MAFQEFMIAPTGANSMADAVRIGSEVYQELKKVVKEKFGQSATSIGDEGGFAPPISKPHEALDLLNTAIANCNYTGKVKLAIDPASSEFLKIIATTLDSRVSLKQYYHKKNFPSFIMGLYRNTPLYCSKTHLRRMTGQHGPHLMKTAR